MKNILTHAVFPIRIREEAFTFHQKACTLQKSIFGVVFFVMVRFEG